MESQDLLAFAGNIPALAFVFWMSHRLTTITIPRIASEFQEALKLQRDDFRESIRTEREGFAAQMEREREFHETQVGAIVSSIKDLG